MFEKCLHKGSLVFLFVFGFVSAQEVISKIDRTAVRIGLPLRYTIELVANDKDQVTLGSLNDWGDQIVVLSKKRETENIDVNHIKYRYELLLTAYDSGRYSLPPVPVVINARDTLYTQRFGIMVKDLAVDAFKRPLYEIKDIIYEPYSWGDHLVEHWVYFVFVGLCLALLGSVGILFFIKRRERSRIGNSILPPYEEALRSLEKLDNKSYWQQVGKTKSYYTELTDILRRYIHRRFGFNAFGSVSDQIIAYLQDKKILSPDQLKEVHELFRASDRVKFAKLKPDLGEAQRHFSVARSFLETTCTAVM